MTQKKRPTLRDIAEDRRLYIVSRVMKAANLKPPYLLIYDTHAGGLVGCDDEPRAVVVEAFSSFQSAATHLRKLDALLKEDQWEWEAVCKHAHAHYPEDILAASVEMSRGWMEMVISASRKISESKNVIILDQSGRGLSISQLSQLVPGRQKIYFFDGKVPNPSDEEIASWKDQRVVLIPHHGVSTEETKRYIAALAKAGVEVTELVRRNGNGISVESV